MTATSPFLRSRTLLGLALLSVILAPASLAFPQGPPGGQGATTGPPAEPKKLIKITISGHIRNAMGGPLPALAMVYLNAQSEEPIARTPVDISGDFEFKDVVPAIYHLVVTAESFVTFRQTIDISVTPVEFYTVNVVLVPAPATEITGDVTRSVTDEAAPRSARKEFEKGSRALDKKNTEEARTHLQKAVGEYPCYARAQIALADLNLAGDKPDDAEKGFKKAIQCDGSFLRPFSQLGQLYYQQKKFQESDDVLSQGLRLFPSSWLLHYQRAAVRFDEGKYSEAVRDFEYAASGNPDMPAEFHAHLANAYLKVGNRAKALTEIETYLRLDPNGKYAASSRQVAQALKNQGGSEANPSAPPVKP